MPRRGKQPEPVRPPRRPPNTGSVIVRGNTRIAVRLPKDLDPKRRPIYGPSPRRRFASREQAVAWLDAEIIARRNPTTLAPSLNETLGAYLLRWMRLYGSSKAPRTRGTYARCLRLFAPIAGVRLGDLTHDVVQAGLVAIQASTWRRTKRGPNGTRIPFGPAYPYQPSTIAQARTVLHVVLDSLVPHVLPYNPVKRAKLARFQLNAQPVWDAEQADRFLDVGRESRPDLAFAFELMLRRALRRGEVVSTLWEDFDARRRLLTVDETAGEIAGETGDTKGRQTRDIPLSAAMVRAGIEHRKAQQPPSRWIFPGRAPDKPISLSQFNTVVREVVRAAGLPPITPKDMRATAATILLDQGVALVRVSRLLGHSDISVTARFYERMLHARQARTDQLADEFDAAFSRASEAAERGRTGADSDYGDS